MLNSPFTLKIFFTVLLAILLSSQSTFAGLFKWTDDAGKTHYTDDKGKIPLKYRTKTKIKKLRSLNGRSIHQEKSSSGDESGAGKTGATGSINEKGILSDQEEQAINNTIAFFTTENERSAKYKGLPNYSPTYYAMRLEIKNNLPAKKKLIEDLSKSNDPTIKETYQFLKKSVAADEQRIKEVWLEGYIGGYFGRILGEIEVKNGLIVRLKAALEESKKLKEEKEKLANEKAEQKKAEQEKSGQEKTAK